MTSTWAWDGARWKWLRSDPQAGIGDMLVYHPALRKVVELAGGITGSPYTMWGFDASGWAQLLPAAVPQPGQGLALLAEDDPRHQLLALVPQGNGTTSTWTFDGATWTRVATANNPPGRSRAMAYDPDSSVVMLYGGGFNGVPDDTWTWDGTTWTEKHPATTAGGCALDQLAYDAAVRQMILLCQSSAGVSMWSWTGATWTQLHPSAMPPAAWQPMMTYDAIRGELVYFCQPKASPAPETWTYANGNWKKAA